MGKICIHPTWGNPEALQRVREHKQREKQQRQQQQGSRFKALVAQRKSTSTPPEIDPPPSAA